MRGWDGVTGEWGRELAGLRRGFSESWGEIANISADSSQGCSLMAENVRDWREEKK